MLYLAQMTLLAVAAALSFWRGGWPERSIAVIMVAWAVFDHILHTVFSHAEIYEAVDLWHLGSDVVGLALFLVVALKADRIWPLWICSLQLLSVLGHALRIIDEQMFELVYAIFQRFPFWLEILLLIWGSAHQAWRPCDEREEPAVPRSGDGQSERG